MDLKKWYDSLCGSLLVATILTVNYKIHLPKSADLTVFSSHPLLKGNIQTHKHTSRQLNVDQVCEVESQLRACGAKVWQAVVFSQSVSVCVCVSVCVSVCVWLSRPFVSCRARLEGFTASLGRLCVIRLLPWHETSHRPFMCWRRDVNAPLHKWKAAPELWPREAVAGQSVTVLKIWKKLA